MSRQVEWVDIELKQPEVYEKVLVCGGDIEVELVTTIGAYTPEYGANCFECDISLDEMGRDPELRLVEFWSYFPKRV